MNQGHSNNVGARVATRFKTLKMKSPIGMEYSSIRQRKSNKATLWTLLKLAGLVLVLLVFSLTGFIAGNFWELYPELNRIDFGIRSDVLIVAMTAGLALSILVWLPASQTAAIGCAIMVAAVYWGVNNNHSTTWHNYTMTEQKPTFDQKPRQQPKPMIVPHMRRRLCLENGTDSDRIECQKLSDNKHRYTWATL